MNRLILPLCLTALSACAGGSFGGSSKKSEDKSQTVAKTDATSSGAPTIAKSDKGASVTFPGDAATTFGGGAKDVALAKGDYTIVGADGKAVDAEPGDYTWASSDESVARVTTAKDGKFLIAAGKIGTVTLTGTCDTCAVKTVTMILEIKGNAGGAPAPGGTPGVAPGTVAAGHRSDIVIAQGSHFVELLGGDGVITRGGGHNLDAHDVDDVKYWDDSLLAKKFQILQADFNGDGRQDLVIVQGSHLVEMLGQADGSLARGGGHNLDGGDSAQVKYWDDYVAKGKAKVLTGDFNGDGKADVVVVQGSHFVELIGNANGGLDRAGGHNLDADDPAKVSYWDEANDAHRFPIVAADFTGDGKTDVLIIQGSHFVLLAGQADGSLARVGGHNLDSGDGFEVSYWDTVLAQGKFDLLTGDFNGDKAQDLVIVQGSHFVEILGNPSGAMTRGGGHNLDVQSGYEVAYWDEALSAHRFQLLVDDFTGDGKSDIVIVQGSHFVELTGNAAGGLDRGGGHNLDGFDGKNVAYWDEALSAAKFEIKHADYNGDGKADIVVVQGSHFVELLGNANGGLDRGAGHNLDGLDGRAVAYWDTALAPGKFALLSGDFNGDGKADIVIVQGSHFVELTGNASGALDRSGGHNLDSDDVGDVAYWDALLSDPARRPLLFVGDFDGG